ncbi:hypothetical protein MCERE10_03861 [Burkholderiaceae bacterium]
MSESIDRGLKVLALTAIFLIAMTGVYAARGLYSDGSFWLVEMLPRGGFYIFDPHRAYVQVLVQAPVAFAIWLGSLDLNLLIRLHSFGFVGVPIIFWLGALMLQFRTKLFWFFLMAFTVSYLRSNFFAAGEFSTAYGLTAFCVAVLLKEKVSLLNAVLMFFSAIALTHSYEATIFLGVFLAAIAVVRLVKVPDDRLAVRIVLYALIAIFLLSIYVGARSTFFQRSYDGKGAANLSALTEIHLLYLMVMPFLVALLCTNFGQRIKKLLMAVFLSFSGLYLLYAFRWDHTNISFGYFSYAYRALCCFLLIGVLTLAAFLRFWPNVFNAKSLPSSASSYLAVGAMVFFMPMAWLMLYHTHGYYKWAQRFEQEAVALKFHTPIDKTSINTNHGWTHGYNWMWGNPSTSILLRGNAEAMVLNNSQHKGPEPGSYENVKGGDVPLPMDRPILDAYPLKPFEKKGSLFRK